MGRVSGAKGNDGESESCASVIHLMLFALSFEGDFLMSSSQNPSGLRGRLFLVERPEDC